MIYYYKLRQVDFDGHFTNSNIISARLKKKNDFLIYVVHESKNDKLEIVYDLPQAGELSVRLLNASGQVVRNLKGGYQAVGKCFSEIDDDWSQLKGIYFIECLYRENRKILKIIF